MNNAKTWTDKSQHSKERSFETFGTRKIERCASARASETMVTWTSNAFHCMACTQSLITSGVSKKQGENFWTLSVHPRALSSTIETLRLKCQRKFMPSYLARYGRQSLHVIPSHADKSDVNVLITSHTDYTTPSQPQLPPIHTTETSIPKKRRQETVTPSQTLT